MGNEAGAVDWGDMKRREAFEGRRDSEGDGQTAV